MAVTLNMTGKLDSLHASYLNEIHGHTVKQMHLNHHNDITIMWLHTSEHLFSLKTYTAMLRFFHILLEQ